jgi:hypothetical protein
MMMLREAISKLQIKAIHAAIHALGWDDDLYRQVLAQRFGATTCKALSRAQAAALLDELAAKGAMNRAPTSTRPLQRRQRIWPPPPDRRGAIHRAQTGGTITEKQQRYIDRLFYRLGWDQARRDGLCMKLIGRPWPQTNSDMDRLLRVLLPMVKRYPGGYDRATGGGGVR